MNPQRAPAQAGIQLKFPQIPPLAGMHINSPWPDAMAVSYASPTPLIEAALP